MAREDKTKDQLVDILNVVGVQEDVERNRMHGRAKGVIDRLALEDEVIDDRTKSDDPYGWLQQVLVLTEPPALEPP